MWTSAFSWPEAAARPRTSVAVLVGLALSLIPLADACGQPLRRPRSNQTASSTAEQFKPGTTAKIDENHPIVPLLERAYESRKALDAIQDYEAVFSKREIVGKKLLSSTLNLKIREEPFCVYLKFVDTSNAGREVLYFSGRNDGKLLVHEDGISRLLGTFKFKPDDKTVMAENRYPITMVGMRNLVEKVIQQWEFEGQYGEMEVQHRPESKLDGRECDVLEATHPQPRNQFKYHLTRLWIDSETKFPVRVEQYLFPTKAGEAPQIVEEYTYTKIRVNLGLGDNDFDPKNPKFNFP